MAKLTPKQLRFCSEYVIDSNATQAATRAGYSARSAATTGSRTLQIVEVQAEIARLTAQIAEAAIWDATEIARRLGVIAEHCGTPIDVTRVDEVTGEEVVIDVEIPNAAAANRALELLGKYRAMFADKVEHSGPGGGPIKQDTTWVVEFVDPTPVEK